MSGTNYVSMSLSVEMQRNLDSSTHNLANSTTTGFKASRPLFQSYIPDRSGLLSLQGVAYVKNIGTYIDQSQGTLMKTGSPYDVAISGDGWFSFAQQEGPPGFSRNGNLTVSQNGNLVTVAGYPILSSDGNPVAIPQENTGLLSIGKDGVISAEDGTVLGQIGVFKVPANQRLNSIGNSLFVPGEGEDLPLQLSQDAEVLQGFIEQSNVQPILEMTRMMDIQRAYERAAKLTSGNDDLTRQAIQRLGRYT